jgi:Sec-independent protein secretion pathway component TatC
MSMLLMASPLYILYEFGLFLLKFFPPSRVARGLHAAPQREGPDVGDE